MMDQHTRFFRVDRRDLVYLKFIMEAHEGLATLSTADKIESIVRVTYHDCCSLAVESMLAALQKEIVLTETSDAG
jgi:hypothetical protein